ncbi:hypothetical protein GWK47_048519 [Chionoecetes opilio]|uniref:Uncharacterized protein n=1 Tax=Chionoecetes opilio TaxID=41210 RepID=A0A8J4Y3V0_CHIOP|nr:hypothetical protein GWK47_048519 [Chionoecetes opilio]
MCPMTGMSAHQACWSGHASALGVSQLSLARLSTMGKGGTLPRHLKISSTTINGISPKANKKDKGLTRLLRRESFSSASQREPSTQWFDCRSDVHSSPHHTIPENHREHSSASLTSMRPKRTELDVERLFTARPRSLTLTPPTPSTPSPSIGSRESLHTPTGSILEEDDRPPLPVKQRDQDGESLYRLSASSLPNTNKASHHPMSCC